MSAELDVAVVGAGIAGLSVGHHLTRAGFRVRVFESAGRVGGRMATDRGDGYRTDTGAEMISARGYPATWRLIRAMGLTPAEVPGLPDPVSVWRDGRARRNAGRPLGLLTGAGLSPRARLALARLQAGLGRRRRDYDTDHPESSPVGSATVAELTAGLPDELAEYLIHPLVGGFFGWLPERSAAAPFLAHLLATGDTTRWRTYRDGMDTLATRLAGHLDVRLDHPVHQVRVEDGEVVLSGAGTAVRARTVVLAVPAPVAVRLHPDAPAAARAYLAASRYAPMIRLACRTDRPFRPAGGATSVLLVPRDHDLGVITFDDHKCAERAPAGHGLVTLLAAPGAARELLDADDEVVRDRLLRAAEPILPGLRAAVTGARVYRFPDGLPEATPAALEARAGFLQRPADPVDYAGDWVMARPCSEAAVRSAELVTPRVRAMLATPRRAAVAGA